MIVRKRVNYNRGFVLGAVVVAALFVWPSEASAYIDPSAGSMLFQVAVGGLLAGIGLVRIYWGKLRGLVRRSHLKPPSSGSAQD